jgi:hypothetical protein
VKNLALVVFLFLALVTSGRAQQVTSFPAANLPLSGSETIYLVQNGNGRQTQLGNIAAATACPLFGCTFNGPVTFGAGLSGTLTGNVTGHASLDLPLTGGIISGAFSATSSVTLPGLLAGTQVSCLGLNSSNSVVLGGCGVSPAGPAQAIQFNNTTFGGTANATLDSSGDAFFSGTLQANGAATLGGGGTFTGTFAGTPTFSGATTFSASGTALSVTNNATVHGSLTNGAGSGQSNFDEGSTGTWVFRLNGATSLLSINSGNTSTPALMQFSSSANNVVSAEQLVINQQGNSSTPVWGAGCSPSACSPLTGGGPIWTGNLSSSPAVIGFNFVYNSNIAGGTQGTVGGNIVLNSDGTSVTGPLHAVTITANVNVAPSTFWTGPLSALNTITSIGVNSGGTSMGSIGTVSGALVGFNPVLHWGPHATFQAGGSNEFDEYAEAVVVTASLSGSTLNITAGCSASIAVGDSVQAEFGLSALPADTTIAGVGTCSAGAGTFTVNNSGTVSSEKMTIGSSVYTKTNIYIAYTGADAVQGSSSDSMLLFGTQGGTTQGAQYAILFGAPTAGDPIPKGWAMGFAAAPLGVGGGIAALGGIDMSNLVPTVAFMRGPSFTLDASGNWTATSLVSGAASGGSEGAGTVNAAASYYANGTAGLASKACTITTAAVAAGVTITITGGIVTATGGC